MLLSHSSSIASAGGSISSEVGCGYSVVVTGVKVMITLNLRIHRL